MFPQAYQEGAIAEMADSHLKSNICYGLLQASELGPGARAALSGCAMVPRLAAIRIADDTPTDFLLERVVRTLQDEGRTVAGFIQRQGCQDLSGHAEMLLEEIPSGRRFCISQSLGKDARGCRLDPRAVAEIAGPFLGAIESRPDLLVINRFGKGESEGQGFRTVLEKAFMLDIPVLTSVKEAYVDAWEAFADSCAASLPDTLEDVLDWARNAVANQAKDRAQCEELRRG